MIACRLFRFRNQKIFILFSCTVLDAY